jgi:hypothetical protein
MCSRYCMALWLWQLAIGPPQALAADISMTAVDPTKQFEEVRPVVERLLGASSPPGLVLKVIDQQSLTDTISENLLRRLDPQRWAARSFTLSALGVIQQGSDLRASYAEALSRYEDVIFDPTSKIIYFAPTPNSFANRLAMTRTLAVAIDDQKFGLLRKRDTEPDDDAFQTYSAITSGSAANLVTQFLLSTNFWQLYLLQTCFYM